MVGEGEDCFAYGVVEIQFFWHFIDDLKCISIFGVVDVGYEAVLLLETIMILIDTMFGL